MTRFFDLFHRVLDHPFPGAGSVDARDDQIRDLQRLCTLPASIHGAVLQLYDPLVIFPGGENFGVFEMRGLELDDLPIFILDPHQSPGVSEDVHEISGLTYQGPGDHPGGQSGECDGSDDRRCADAQEDGLISPSSELVSVSPGGELRSKGNSDADQLGSLQVPGQADVLR